MRRLSLPHSYPRSTFAYLQSDFASIDGRLRTPNSPAFFGNSSLNPARFPSPNVSFWAYLDDLVVNKTGTSDYEPYLSEAWNFIVSWFSDYSYTTPFNLFPASVQPNAITAASMPPGRFRVSPELPADQQLYSIVMKQFERMVPSGLFHGPPDEIMVQSEGITDASSSTSTPWTTILNITFGLGSVLINKNFF